MISELGLSSVNNVATYTGAAKPADAISSKNTSFLKRFDFEFSEKNEKTFLYILDS